MFPVCMHTQQFLRLFQNNWHNIKKIIFYCAFIYNDYFYFDSFWYFEIIILDQISVGCCLSKRHVMFSLQSSKDEEITLAHESFWVFTLDFIGVILIKECWQKWGGDSEKWYKEGVAICLNGPQKGCSNLLL